VDLPVGKKQSKEFWKAHVDACASSSSSIAAYCEGHGLSKSQLTYYRQKFSRTTNKSKFAEVKAIAAAGAAASPAVKEPVAHQTRLPDAKWLAALIRELAR
jgi:transposase-like protein